MTDTGHTPAPRALEKAAILVPMLAVAVICMLRLAILGMPALTDNTESRHAVIALNMESSGDWVTPRFAYEGRVVPFWGKPPLLFWLNAASFRVFGASESSARLPGYLAGLAMLAMTFGFARRFWGLEVAALSTLVLSSSMLFFALAGSVTVDIILAACTTGALAAFACFAESPPGRSRRLWGVTFAVALGLGMLAKGPIAVALSVISVLVYLGVAKRWRLLAEYPWGWGLAAFVAVAAPWFVLAEHATPGFWKYYFVNEHILRYVSRQYGDLYGSGHTKPYGTVWPLLAAGAMPWTVVLVGGAATRLAHRRPIDPRMAYVLAWALVPAVFFTFARQLIITYLLPGFAALAVATGVILAERDEGEPSAVTLWLLRVQGFVWTVVLAGAAVYAGSIDVSPAAPGVLALLALITLGATAMCWRRGVACLAAVQAVVTAAFVVTAVLAYRGQFDEQYSAKIAISSVAARSDLAGRALVFPYDEPSSAELYSRLLLGTGVRHIPQQEGDAAVRRMLETGSRDVLVLARRHWKRVSPEVTSRLRVELETPSWVVCVVSDPPRAVTDPVL